MLNYSEYCSEKFENNMKNVCAIELVKHRVVTAVKSTLAVKELSKIHDFSIKLSVQ